MCADLSPGQSLQPRAGTPGQEQATNKPSASQREESASHSPSGSSRGRAPRVRDLSRCPHTPRCIDPRRRHSSACTCSAQAWSTLPAVDGRSTGGYSMFQSSKPSVVRFSRTAATCSGVSRSRAPFDVEGHSHTRTVGCEQRDDLITDLTDVSALALQGRAPSRLPTATAGSVRTSPR